MRSLTLLSTFARATTLACGLLGSAGAAPADVKLPAETAKLRASTLPGYAIASQKCGICHSADYVQYQPPRMTKTQWTTEMTKMQHVYGAPLSDDDIRLLGIYLAATYGDASTVTAEDREAKATTVAAAAPGPDPQPAAATKIDVQALLAGNGCLACHALDHKVVGPGFHDVAVRYQADPQALAQVTASIQKGGSGKWGPVPMPPFPALDADDAKALATYVLSQSRKSADASRPGD